jgi:hypothetical protein
MTMTMMMMTRTTTSEAAVFALVAGAACAFGKKEKPALNAPG